MRVIWAPRALERVVEIGQHIAADRPDAARKWAQALFDRASALRQYPTRGRRVPEIGRDEVREIIHGAYRVIYRLDPTQIMVLTVRHGRRAWDPAEVE